jgi:molybdate transport system ATP-binding protein
LERPDAGSIEFRGRTWCDTASVVWLPPQQRRAGLLFQEGALFPHLTVQQNVSYADRGEKAESVMERFGLGEFASRLPGEISAGQRQRVALARALAADPALLLLDEPLSALDAATRVRMRRELRTLLLAGGVSSILVTHDRAEAIALGDWMAVMVEGVVRQAGPVREVFRKPLDAQVAEVVGMENILAADVASRSDRMLVMQVGAAKLECLDTGEPGPLYACIRAEDVTITRDAGEHSSARNRLAAQVESVNLEGALARLELDCGFPLLAVITAQSAAEMGLKPGDRVWAVVKATAIHLTAAG